MSNLIFDSHLSSGLLWAGYKEGWLTGTEKLEKLKSDFGDNHIKRIIQPKSSSKYTRKALELALIYDSVSLSGVPGDILFDWEKLNSEGLIGGALGRGHVPSNVNFSHDYIESKIEPLHNYLHQRYVKVAREFTEDQNITQLQSKRITLVGLHLIRINKINSGKSLFDFYQNFEHLINYSSQSEFLDLYNGLAESIVALTKQLSLDVMTIILSLLELYSLIMNVITLDSMSHYSGLPVASPIFGQFGTKESTLNNQADLSHQAYRICCLSMTETINYVPVVDSIDDVLRLRNDKRIKNFRTALTQWAFALEEGIDIGIQEIKKEVCARSSELTGLEKWRKTDRWLYHVTLPVSFIPIISNIHTVLSYGVRMKIEHVENKNWLLLGR